MRNIDLFRKELRGKYCRNWGEHRELENVPRKESEREREEEKRHKCSERRESGTE